MTKSVANYGFEGEGVEPPTKFSKRGGGELERISFSRGGCWERGGNFFQGGWVVPVFT